MKNIIFKKTVVENYALYTGDPFEYEYENGKLAIICGRNGVGKTTLFESIPLCLYGKTSKGLTIDDLINNKINKNCRVSQYFDIVDDNDQTKSYEIHRYKKYRGMPDAVLIGPNGEEIANGKTEVKNMVEKMILPEDVFMNTIFFTQKVKDFFTALTDSKQKEIFRKILNLERFNEYIDKINLLYKSLEKEKITIQNNISINMDLHSQVTSSIEMQNQLIKNFNDNRQVAIDILNSERDDFISKLSASNISIEEEERKQNEFQQNLDSVLKKKNDLVLKTQADTAKIRTKYADLKNEKRAEYQKKESEIESKCSEKRLEIDRKANDNKQQIIRKYSDKKSDQLKRHKENSESLINSINEIKIKINEHANECKILNSRIEFNKNQINDLEKSLNLETSVCPLCLAELDDKTTARLKDKITSLTAEIEGINGEIKKHSDEINKLKQIGIETKTKLDGLDTENDKILKEIEFEMNSEVQNEITNKLNDLLEKLNDHKNKLIKQNYDYLMNNIYMLSSTEENEIKNIESVYNKDIRELQVEQSSLETQKVELEKNKIVLSELKEIKSKLYLVEEKIGYEKQKQFDSTVLEANKMKLFELEKKIEEENVNLSNNNENLEIYEFWKKACSPSGIQSMLIDEAIPFMNKWVSSYLDILSNGRYVVSFDSMDQLKSGEFRDKISVNVFDTETRNSNRKALSGGQERLIDIATILTLNKLQAEKQKVSFNILLLDEIFDALDEDNSEMVAKVLRKIIQSGKSVNIISHVYKNEIEADRILEIKN